MASKVGTKPFVEKKEVNKKESKKKGVVSKDDPKEAVHNPFKLRILCLHGFRTSGKIMAEQITQANWSPLIDDIADLVFMDAPWPASGKSDVEKRFAGPYYEWYQANEDFTEVYGLSEATSNISSFIMKHGPFDGIMGFSQGAILSAALIGLNEKGLGPNLPNINFLIFVGGGQSKAKLLRPAYFETIMCTSLHMIGNKDYMKESSELLVKAFCDPIVIRHPSGHVVPALGPLDEMAFREFLLKQFEEKNPHLLGGLSQYNQQYNREASVSYFEDQIALSSTQQLGSLENGRDLSSRSKKASRL